MYVRIHISHNRPIYHRVLLPWHSTVWAGLPTTRCIDECALCWQHCNHHHQAGDDNGDFARRSARPVPSGLTTVHLPALGSIKDRVVINFVHSTPCGISLYAYTSSRKRAISKSNLKQVQWRGTAIQRLWVKTKTKQAKECISSTWKLPVCTENITHFPDKPLWNTTMWKAITVSRYFQWLCRHSHENNRPNRFFFDGLSKLTWPLTIWRNVHVGCLLFPLSARLSLVVDVLFQIHMLIVIHVSKTASNIYDSTVHKPFHYLWNIYTHV